MTGAAVEWHPSSFRDPNGWLFRRDGVLYRQVNDSYSKDYEHLKSSGLYDHLISRGLLVAHEEAPQELGQGAPYRVLRPELVPVISYPYEWCFSQLKDAALLTLEVQLAAMKHGMSLKDASAYNVQFLGGRPVFIDTLSFERLEGGGPWVAYRQFCQHFLAPLALVANCDVRLQKLMRPYIDGIPLDLASRLLPARTRLKFGLLTHVHMHAASQKRYSAAATGDGKPNVKVSRHGLEALIDSLKSTVSKLSWDLPETEWRDYYASTNYSDDAFDAKLELVSSYLEDCAPIDGPIFDLGANTGRFSRLADKFGPVVACDIDEAAVELNYLALKREGGERILPLIMDLTNPSPALGWAHEERSSLTERGDAPVALALALIHHLAISNNVPLAKVARFLAAFCRKLVIEFVPKSDSQVQRLLATREDIFDEYHAEGFEEAFRRHFEILRAEPVKGSERTLYLMRRADG